MKCSAFLLPENAKTNAVKFIFAIFDATRCEREAVFFGPDDRPLCSTCATERKRAHESGQTIMSMALRDSRGEIPPFKLRPIQ